MRTIALLTVSNLFMPFPWCGHLKFRHVPLWLAIGASSGIVFFEYCLQVPANRYGYGQFIAAHLKDHSGSDYGLDGLGFLSTLLAGAAQMEHGDGICADCGRRVGDFYMVRGIRTVEMGAAGARGRDEIETAAHTCLQFRFRHLI